MTSRSALSCTTTIALLGLFACDPKVADPGDEQHIEEAGEPDDEDDAESDGDSEDPDSAEGGSSVGTSVGCEGDDCGGPDDPPPPVGVEHAFAIHWGDVPEIDIGESDSGGSGGGSEGPGPFGDPESILVSIGNGNDSCENSWGEWTCGQWSVSFTLPADVVPGSYSLTDLNGGQSATGPDRGGGDCSGGGGSLEGTLVIESIDDGLIVGHIEDAVWFDFDANISFSAAICG